MVIKRAVRTRRHGIRAELAKKGRQGRMAEESHYQAKLTRPIVNAMRKMRERGYSYGQLQDWLRQWHGIEVKKATLVDACQFRTWIEEAQMQPRFGPKKKRKAKKKGSKRDVAMSLGWSWNDFTGGRTMPASTEGCG